MSARISHRGRALSSDTFPPYLQAHVERQDDPGYTALSVAENLQMWDLLGPKLTDVAGLPPEAVSYQDGDLAPRLRGAVADLLGRELFRRPVDPAHVRLMAGASPVIEAVGIALCDPGDVVLVPTPSYAGFWFDLGGRAEVQVHPVPRSPEDGWRLTPDMLDEAVLTAPGPVRAVLLTNPDNPLGQVMPAADVAAILDWCDRRDVHVIADEVYGLTVWGEDAPFPSVGSLGPSLGDRVHVIWAASKDLGMSGMRVGVLVSEHEQLRQAVDVQSLWSGVGGLTQHAMARMLGDEGWITGFLATARQRLRDLHQQVAAELDAAGVPHQPTVAGFFTLLDLRGWLDAPTPEAEHALWSRLLDDVGVNLTPGSAIRSPQPGWFRMCWAANPPEVVLDAVRRVVAALA